MANEVKFLKTFRARLMLLLTACLLLTIAVVLVLDYLAQRAINKEIERQKQQVTDVFNEGFGDLAQAFFMGTESLRSSRLLYQIYTPEQIPKTIEVILVADKDGKVIDSSLPDLIDE